MERDCGHAAMPEAAIYQSPPRPSGAGVPHRDPSRMAIRRMSAWVFAAVLVAGGAYWLSSSKGSGEVQPLGFDHEKHLTAKRQSGPITCQTCHRFYSTRLASGRPGVAICADCHATTKPESPEMVKLRRFIDERREIPWKRVYKLPDHVFYSHRTHVVAAKLECETCHGPVGKQNVALVRPLKPILMETCTGCHRAKKVTNDCNACHR